MSAAAAEATLAVTVCSTLLMLFDSFTTADDDTTAAADPTDDDTADVVTTEGSVLKPGALGLKGGGSSSFARRDQLRPLKKQCRFTCASKHQMQAVQYNAMRSPTVTQET